MYRPLMLLINPIAGKGKYKNALSDILSVFCGAQFLPTVFFTDRPGHATEIVSRRGADYSRIVCIGGDGTLSEAVSGLMSLPSPPELGYIPMGTANDVAATLGLSRNPAESAKTAAYGNVRPLDIGAMDTGEFFTYIAAFGAFTDVSYQTSQERKQALGHLAYIIQGMMSLPKITPRRARVEYDGGVMEEDFIFGGVTNSTSVAGLVKLDSSIVGLSDGMFEVILVKNPTSAIELNSLATDLMSRKYSGQNMTILHSRKVVFTFEAPVAWTRDGENGGEHQQLTLTNLHAALRIIVD